MTEQAETFETVNQWCDDTFGPASPKRILERAAEEWDELAAEIEAGNIPRAAVEAADVVICLCRIPGFAEAFQAKMRINRGRKWRLTGEGTGYHIPAQGPSQ